MVRVLMKKNKEPNLKKQAIVARNVMERLREKSTGRG